MRGLELLLEPAGLALLDGLPPYDPAAALHVGQELRDLGHDPDLVAAAMTQSRLRAKAAAKFGPRAAHMLLTEAGLAQATRWVVATHHAARYRAAQVTSVADLTCGVGGDAMALAEHGMDVLATDLDEPTAMIAAHNLRTFPHVRVVHGDGLSQNLTHYQGIYADPARRQGDRRVFDPAAYSPPLDRVLALAATHALGIKVGPGIAHHHLPPGCEAQWVSVDGDVVECGLWFGPLRGAPALHAIPDAATHPGDPPRPGHSPTSQQRTALVLVGNQAFDVRDSGAGAAHVGALGEYIYEPDGAVIRAGLVSEVAVATHGRLLDPTIAYVTCDAPADVPVARGYRVADCLPFGVKRLRTYLRERGIGAVEIKKRGTAVTPEQLRPQLRLRGQGTATLILTRIANRQVALVATPL